MKMENYLFEKVFLVSTMPITTNRKKVFHKRTVPNE